MSERDQDDVREEIRAWRIAEDLPAELGLIDRLTALAVADDHPTPGLWLTAEELNDMASVDEEVATRVQRYFEAHPEHFAGLAVDWEAGQRVVRVGVTAQLETHRRKLAALGPSERVRLEHQPYSHQEILRIAEQISADCDQLAQEGVEIFEVSYGYPERVEIGLVAADPDAARRLLGERYGPAVSITQAETAHFFEQPHPFAEYHADGPALTVFCDLPLSNEHLGSCRADEFEDRVIVHLALARPVGLLIGVGGQRHTQTTILLAEPLGDRIVIDASNDQPRRPRPG